jgi:ankyrin repeat protein
MYKHICFHVFNIYPCIVNLFLLHVQDGTSPLYIAAQSGHVEAINVLIKAGAQVNLQKEVIRERERFKQHTH